MLKENIRAIRVLMAIVFVITMVASFIGGREESLILVGGVHVRTTLSSNPLEVKGKTYFVSDEQYSLFQWSRRIFIAGALILIGLIAASRIIDKKRG